MLKGHEALFVFMRIILRWRAIKLTSHFLGAERFLIDVLINSCTSAVVFIAFLLRFVLHMTFLTIQLHFNHMHTIFCSLTTNYQRTSFQQSLLFDPGLNTLKCINYKHHNVALFL